MLFPLLSTIMKKRLNQILPHLDYTLLGQFIFVVLFELKNKPDKSTSVHKNRSNFKKLSSINKVEINRKII